MKQYQRLTLAMDLVIHLYVSDRCDPAGRRLGLGEDGHTEADDKEADNQLHG
ncbi:MAG: hypothetical protein VYE68_08055 [Acidobacteriota bacterium]|nr:hypothetical protein [Acidobacteriota bacterium]